MARIEEPRIAALPSETGNGATLTERFNQHLRWLQGLPEPYNLTDISPFTPAPAIYFMNGYSDVSFRLYASGEEVFLAFWDRNTSISASAPIVYEQGALDGGLYVVVPRPLKPVAYGPYATPSRYLRDTSMHLMQVISMNMRGTDHDARLLIGLPYAEKYPELFFSTDLLESGNKGGVSYGIVQSVTDFVNPVTGAKDVRANGYPARSFFAIYHILETPFGVFFNKKATQMELQPDEHNKLALDLPPIPFNYSLINGPIPLYDARDPQGQAVGEVVAAHHQALATATYAPTAEAWPWHIPEGDPFSSLVRGDSSTSRERI